MTKRGFPVLLSLILTLQTASPYLAHSETYEELEMSARNLILPEMEQFLLGSRLFFERDKKVAAWKAFQTFIYNYPDSKLIPDAQYMLAESIFSQALQELKAGSAPDEYAWEKSKKGGLKTFGKGLKKGFTGLKNLGAVVAGETTNTKEDIENIDRATFSEAIKQYLVVEEKYRKSGLADTALFRLAESHYNIGDYPKTLDYFKEIQKSYAQSYTVPEAMLGVAQLYLASGEHALAESEVKKLTSTYPSYESEPRTQLVSGIILFQAGKYEECLKNLENLKDAEALFYCGQALIKLGKPVSATAKFKKVAEEFKDSTYAEAAAYYVGDTFFLSKNYLGAVQEFRKFLTNYPQSALKEGVLYKIASSHFLRKDYPAARESLNLLLNSYPSGEFAPRARYFIAESYRLAKQLKEASFSYGQMISEMPNSPVTANARYKLAWITYQQENYSGASDLFQKFIDWHPTHEWVPQAYLLMGNCSVKLNRYEESVNYYQQAFDRAPKTEVAEAALALLNRSYYTQGSYGQLTSGFTYILKSLLPTESKWRAVSQLYLADAYYRQKLYKEAISIFQSIVSLYPHHPAAVQAHDGLFWCYFQMGDYDKAQTERSKMNTVRLPEGVSAPATTTGNFELANALFNQKKYMEALENYEKFIRESPNASDVPEAIYRMGLCYYRQEYYSQAISTWEGLEAKYPQHERTEEAAFQIGDTYFRAQKYDKAVETYKKILARYPNNPNIMEANLKIGQAYYNSGDDEKALTEIDAFLRKYPDDPKSVETLDIVESSLDRYESHRGDRKRGVTLLSGIVESYPRSKLASEAQYRLARRFFNVKDYQNAAAEFEKLSLNYADSPHIAEGQFYSGECLYLLKNYPDSIQAFQRFLKNFPTSEFASAALFHMGTAQYNSQNYNDAIGAYQMLILQYPTSEYSSAALFNTALCQKKMLKLVEAADSYMKLALNYPADQNATFALLENAKIKQELKQHGEAILTLKDLDAKVKNGDELKQEINFLIADNYFANNDPEEAKKSLNTVLSLEPRGSAWKLEAYRKLGEIHEKQEDWSGAVRAYEDAARMSGNAQIAASFRERARYISSSYLKGSAPAQPAPAQKAKPQKTTGGGR